MADNTTYTPGSGATIAADEIGGALHQRVKVSVGADGAAADWEGAVTVSSSALPTGAATSAKQDTGNTSLASIDGKVTACNTGAVVVSSSSLPTGAATSAKQDTIIGHVDGIEGLLTTIDADTGNIATSAASIDGKITACNTGSIAGTVTANAGTNLNTSALALESGGNLASIKSNTDKIPALGQALAAASVPVVLTASQLSTLTPPAAITGFATESTLSTLNGKVTACNTGAVTVSSSALPSGAATAAKQPALGTAGSASSDVITVQGVASMTPLDVAIVSGSSAGTEYTEGATDASITGTAILWEDAGNTLATVSAANPLPVTFPTGAGAATEAKQDDQIDLLTTIDADTSAIAAVDFATETTLGTLALESGGNLAASATSLAIVDDWDESDRAKVNVIAGQAGITAGAGAVAANTPRVTLASDDPAVASLSVLDDWDSSDSCKVVGPAAHDAAVSNNPLCIGGVASAAAPTSVNADQDAVRAWFLRNGAQATVITAAGALVGGDATNGLDVDVTRIIPGTTATALGKAEDAVHASGDTGVMALTVRSDTAAATSGTTGDYQPLITDSTGRLWTHSFCEGVAAHDAAVSGSPILIASEARDTLGTAVATGDVCRQATNRYGATLVSAYPTSHASSNGTPITATTTSVIAAPSAGSHLRILRVHISNGGSTATWVAVRDGASGTRHYNTYLMQGCCLSINLNASGPLDLTTATRLDIVLSAAGSVEYEIDYVTVAD